MNPKDLDLFSQHASTRKETNRLFVVRCNFCFALLCHLCISDVNYAPPQEDQPLPSARSLRQQHEHTVFAPWSSGVVNMAILGSDVLGVVGYHSGIQTSARVVRSENSTVPMVAKVLLHSGVDDDAATDVALLEQEFEGAKATYEIVPWYCFKILVFLLYMFLYGLCSYTPLRTIARVVLWPHLPYRRPVLCLTIPYQGSKGHPGPGYLIHFHVSIRLVCASPANNKTLDLTRCQELKPYQVRYGSNVVHSFTEWQANNAPFAMYDHRADYRSWESTKLFLKAERRVGES